MKVRWTPQSLRFPALKGKLIVYASRGQMYVRSWPRRRGPSKSAEVRRQVTWFKEANKLAKIAVQTQQALAISMTKGTGMYPRDLLLRQMSGGIYDIFDEDGRHYQVRQRFRETVVFQGVILEQTAGQSFPAGVTTIFTWPLPVLDTLGFWSSVNPTDITIPAGVNIVTLNGGWYATGNPGNTITILVIRKNGLNMTREGQDLTGLPGHTSERANLLVNEGDILTMAMFTNRAFTSAVGGATRFSLSIVDAD